MKRAPDALLAAFAYFSILPVPARDRGPGADALVALPVVGAVLGAIAGLAAFLCMLLGAPPSLAAAAAFAIDVILTGALHVDGFLDSCDALFAPVSPERRLEILKDPHHGTFALAGMAVATLLWWASVAALAAPLGAGLPLALAGAGATARLAAVLCARIWPDPRTRGAVLAERPGTLNAAPPRFGLVLGAAGCAALALLLQGSLGIAALAVTAIVPLAGLALGAFAARRLGGGLTGDAYGFAIVLCQITWLGLFAIVAPHLPGR